MLKTIFTLDYEIHGNGDGSPVALMVEPTRRLLDMFDSFEAKVTIMAEVGEILRFKRHAIETGSDDFHSSAIEDQLRRAVQGGHDVQLHIHSSYYGARFVDGHWLQDWSEYDFARLPAARMDWMVREGKQYLETLLQPVMPEYRCNVFRAANWSVSPSFDVARALIGNGIQIDTSIFKFGRRSGRVSFDYNAAESALRPWPARADDFCRRDASSPLWEYPIYSEQRLLPAFVTLQRVHRALLGRAHRLPACGPSAESGSAHMPVSRSGRLNSLWSRHAWKADFNQCSGRQLVATLERAHREFVVDDGPLPFVLIGHSKLFSRLNERSLRPLLAHVARGPDRFRFGTFQDFTPARRDVRVAQPPRAGIFEALV